MNYKIFVHSLPASGHINPMTSVVEGLVNEYKTKVFWYSTQAFKTTIENTGTELRELNALKDDISNMVNIPSNSRVLPIISLFCLNLDFTEANFQKIAKNQI